MYRDFREKSRLFAIFSYFFATFSQFYARFIVLNAIKLRTHVRNVLDIHISVKKSRNRKKFEIFTNYSNSIFAHFSVPLHFQHKISGTSFHLINKIVTENDSHERLVSNEWSNVAIKIFYHKKIFSPVNGTFPIFSNSSDFGLYSKSTVPITKRLMTKSVV